MGKWEHAVVPITLDKDVGVYVTVVGLNRLKGIPPVLNYYGDMGWELVSLVAEEWEGTRASFASARVTVYSAVFRRPVP